MAKIKEIKYYIKDKKIIVRSPVLEDAEELIKYVLKINEETTFLLREPDEFNISIEEEEKFISHQIDSEENLFLIAEISGEIIGTCHLTGSKMKRAKHKLDIGIALEKRYWGLGLGKKLMKIAIDWAKSNGISKITLKVDTSNVRAINLYQKIGFEVEGRLLKDKLMDDGSYRNAYLMALIF